MAIALEKVQCIYYLLHFWNDKKGNVWAFIDSDSKVNAMALAYPNKLGLKIQSTNIGV